MRLRAIAFPALPCAACVLLLAGCNSLSTTQLAPVASSKGQIMGHAFGGQSPITGATIQLWQVNTTTDGGMGAALLTLPVTSSDGTGATNSNANTGNNFNALPAGYFTISNNYTCPVNDALVYITASGGNPGLDAGTTNPQSQMVTALGSCNSLKNTPVTINISELTTVGTVAALYPFMSAYNAIGSTPAHASAMNTQFGVVNQYVDFKADVAPGPALASGYYASSPDVNQLANVLAACVNTTGGSASSGSSDGTPCGNLFYDSKPPGGIAATDITAAALDIRKNPQNNSGYIWSLSTPQAPFEPASTTAPIDWKLPILQIPATPTFTLAPGMYTGSQQVFIQDTDPSVTFYYSLNGATPNSYYPVYSAPLTVSQSETLKVIAANSRLSSAVATATYVINGGSNPPTVSLSSVVSPPGSTAPVYEYAYSNANGSVVTFGAADGAFSSPTCVINNSYCSVSYIPSGTLATGIYPNDLTASFAAYGAYAAASATSTLSITSATSTLTPLDSDGLAESTPIQASDGNLYVVASYGPSIFKVDLSGNLSPVYTFPGGANGLYPQGSLLQGTDGNLYGTTAGDGADANGTIFKISTSGAYTLLYTFTGTADGSNPYGALIQGTDGNFYGTAFGGGAYNGGTLFSIDSSGNFTVLHSFNSAVEGFSPYGGLLQAANGNFYGTTLGGGPYTFGTLYEFDTSNGLTTLYNFTGATDGASPRTSLTQGTDGNLYGNTYSGGPYGVGSIFKITPLGEFTALYDLNVSTGGGRQEGSLVLASDGQFYGTAFVASGGALFRIDTSGNFQSLHVFGGTSDGDNVEAGLVQASDSNFYGTDSSGGTGSNGEFFRLSLSPTLTPPVTLTLPSSVTPGAGFNLSYSVVNATSQTLQHCFATNTAGDLTGWTGVKTAATTSTNASLFAPLTPGSYTYTLTCGGKESGFATLIVN